MTRYGRPERNWEAAYAELAALLWHALDSNAKPPDQTSLAALIADNLKAQGVQDAPEASTIKSRFSAIRGRVDQLKQAKNKTDRMNSP